MIVKHLAHRPATPLPWKENPYTRGGRERADIKVDDAYELHAANSYPALVQTLRQVNSGIFATGAPLGSELYFKIRTDIIAVLTQLGELP